MIELGELEKRHEEFAQRNLRIIAISNDNEEDSAATKAQFPHLDVVADPDMKMAEAVAVIDPGKGHKGEDTNAPTTILVAGDGKVVWVKRTGRFIERFSPEDVLKAIDESSIGTSR